MLYALDLVQMARLMVSCVATASSLNAVSVFLQRRSFASLALLALWNPEPFIFVLLCLPWSRVTVLRAVKNTLELLKVLVMILTFHFATASSKYSPLSSWMKRSHFVMHSVSLVLILCTRRRSLMRFARCLHCRLNFILVSKMRSASWSLMSSMLLRVALGMPLSMTMVRRSHNVTLSKMCSCFPSQHSTLNSFGTLAMITFWRPMMTPSWVWNASSPISWFFCSCAMVVNHCASTAPVVYLSVPGLAVSAKPLVA